VHTSNIYKTDWQHAFIVNKECGQQAALWSIKVDKEDVHTGGFNAAALKA